MSDPIKVPYIYQTDFAFGFHHVYWRGRYRVMSSREARRIEDDALAQACNSGTCIVPECPTDTTEPEPELESAERKQETA